MKVRQIGSPGWSFFFFLLPPLIGIALAFALPLVKVVRDWVLGP